MSTSDIQIGKEFYEFGPFRVDPQKQILLRGGEPIALTPKAFQLLLVLVRRAGDVVTKDELMKAVWPDTFVEETNLTRNIFALRKALGETEQNRYIITAPGRGYSFAEQVHLLPEPQVTIVAAKRAKVQIQVQESRRWPWIIAVALAAVAIVAVFQIARSRQVVLTEKDSVIVADFTNSTSEPVFDGTLRQGLAVQLEQSPFLNLISEQRIRGTLSMMGKPVDTALTGETAREVCQRTGAAATIEGSIAPLGSAFVLGLRARNCRTGDVLDDEQEQVARKEDVLSGLSKIAGRFRTHVGESLRSIQQYSTPLVEATTPSLTALHAYSKGWQVHAAHGASASLPFFQRAIEIDSQFAVAHASLGRMYADLDQTGLAAASVTKAWQLRDHASEYERFFISAAYETQVTGNMDAARRICETWAQTYPRDPRSHMMLSGIVYKSPGDYEQALAEAQKAIEMDPDFFVPYYSRGVLNTYLGRIEEGKKSLQAARSRGMDADEFIMLDFDIDFLMGDEAAMKRDIANARTRPSGENWMSAREAAVAAYRGHLREARSISRRAVAEAQQAGQPERAAFWCVGAAIREALFGNRPEAIVWAQSALKLSRDREIEYGVALADAIAGDAAQAQELADELERQYPEDSAVRFNYVPAIRAWLAVTRAEPERAIELLQVSSPYELGMPPSGVSGLYGALQPIYVRGIAYLAAKHPKEAAAEFDKILQHRGIVVNDPIGALSHLQIAKAYVLSGERDRAKAEFDQFLALWKEADHDIPIFKLANDEYASLTAKR